MRILEIGAHMRVPPSKTCARFGMWLIAPCALGLLCMPASGLDLDLKRKARDAYLSRLGAIVSAYADSQAALAAWCRKAGLAEEADRAIRKAQACKPESAEPADAPGPSAEDPARAFAARVKSIEAAASRGYSNLASWCMEKGLLREARRSAEKALAWDKGNSEARALALKPALKARFVYDTLCGNPSGVFKGGRWVAEEGFRKSSEARLKELSAAQSKTSGLAFSGDFLPDVDMLFTVPGEEFAPVKSAVERYLSLVRQDFFLSSPKKPVVFYYLKDDSEFRRLGQNPMMMGAYEWGKGRLYAYPGFMGMGTILHEMTHAMLEAGFRTFPPLWFNEGLASFFETHGDLSGNSPFGVVNWRDAMYAQAVSAKSARKLDQLVKECAMMIDPAGYGQGRTLMNYLWSLGLLEAFVVAAQLKDDGKLDFAAALAEILLKPLPEAGADLEEFALRNMKDGTRIERGVAPDEKVDGFMEAPGRE